MVVEKNGCQEYRINPDSRTSDWLAGRCELPRTTEKFNGFFEETEL